MRTLTEWRAWWRLQGRSMTTQREYQRYLVQLAQRVPLEEATLADVLEFVADGTTPAVRRQRSRSCMAFYRWAHSEGVTEAGWWQRVPSPNEPAAPQRTVTVDDVTTTLGTIRGQTFTAARDRALIAVLWSSGLRRSEVARMCVDDIDLDQGCVMVIGAKGGKPRLAPLSPEAARYLLRYLRHRAVHPHAASPALWLGERGPLVDQGIRQVLERRDAPSAHAFRRGWCVDSLRAGVSQTSVQAAAGWSGPQMVSRYSAGAARRVERERVPAPLVRLVPCQPTFVRPA
jgi:integrase/recombinase XerC